MSPKFRQYPLCMPVAFAIFLGFCFPIGATALLIIVKNLSPTLDNVYLLHRNHLLLWIIWTAPIVLGIFGFILGKALQDLKHQVELSNNNKTELQTLIDSVASAIITINKKGVITSFNHAAENMFGYSANEAIGLNIKNMMPNKVANLHNTYIKSYLNTQQSSIMGKRREVEGKRKNGVVFPMILQVNRMDLHGEIMFSVVIDDISMQKAMQDQLHQAQKMEAIGHLASGVAHEINTPIQYIGDNLNALDDNLKDLVKFLSISESIIAEASDEIRIKWNQLSENFDIDYILQDSPTAIKQSLDGISKVAEIVSAMKAYAHSDSKSLAPVDINELIKNTLIISKNQYKYQADVETKLVDNLPQVECYANEINQVLINLIVNASDAIEEKGKGKGLIKISSQLNDNGILICIEDNGIGIPKNIQDQVFNLFFTTKEVGKGTGQGLSIAHKVIVEKHHGHFHFESKENLGTTFYIELPLKTEGNNFDTQ